MKYLLIIVLAAAVFMGCSLDRFAPITVFNYSSYTANVFCNDEYMGSVPPMTKLAWDGIVGEYYEVCAICVYGMWGPRTFTLPATGWMWHLID